MEKLIEFYQMVSLNGAALRGNEKTAILKAGLALRVFERAMDSFKAISGERPYGDSAQLPDGGAGLRAMQTSVPRERWLIDECLPW